MQSLLRDFIPHRTQLSIATRDLVPAICTVFHVHDTLVNDGDCDPDTAAGLRLPWDVMGGVNALLFAAPTVTMTVEEYMEHCDAEAEDDKRKYDCERYTTKYDGPEIKDYSGRCIRLVGRVPDTLNGRIVSLTTGSGITLDVSAVEGLVGCFSSLLGSSAYTAVRFGSSLQQVQRIETRFLFSHRSLETFQIDVDGLPNATSIGDNLLSYCHALREVDLRPFHNVASIEKMFLGHTGLRSIDLSPLSKVTEISNRFLNGCHQLQSISLTPLRGVTSISDYFLSGCTGLTAIDLTPLRSLREVKLEGWLYGCGSISGVIDLRSLRSVESVSNDWGFLYLHDDEQEEEEEAIINEKPPVRVVVPSENQMIVDALREHTVDYNLIIEPTDAGINPSGGDSKVSTHSRRKRNR